MEVWCWGWVFSNWGGGGGGGGGGGVGVGGGGGGGGGGAEGLILFWTIGLVFSRLSFLHSKIIIKIVS